MTENAPTVHPQAAADLRPRDPLRLARYELPTRIVYGAGALEQLPSLLAEAGVTHPLIITDRGLSATAIPRQVAAVLAANGVEHGIFAEVEPDPTTTVVDAAAALIVEGAHDSVIGLGGGSAMDAAKAAAAVATAGVPAARLVGPGNVRTDPLPIIAIPTTAGTGSEVTQFAVLSDLQAGTKVSLASMRLMPTFAVLEPELTVGLPPGLTASTGLDALGHATESYGSVWNNPISEGMALHAISLIGKYLRAAVANPEDRIARAGMLAASCTAELAANTTRLGLAHALAVPLGATHHVPHGVGVAMILRPMAAFNEEADPARYAPVTAMLDPSANRLSEAMGELYQAVALDARLRDFGVAPEDYDHVIELAMRSDNVRANPRPAGAEELRSLLRAAQ
ncbi:iron-containing alcohol dehydrogenase family protein [Pseudonocardia sichuanensis]